MLPERYLIAGLDALCRSHKDSPRPPPFHLSEGFLLGHRGAGMLACYYLFQDGLVEPTASSAVQMLLDDEWSAMPLFAMSPAGAASTQEFEALLALFAQSMRPDSGDPHSVIFPAYALRVFREHPELITSYRLSGLADMARLAIPETPEVPPPTQIAPLPAFESSSFSEWLLRQFLRALCDFVRYNTSYSGHILTWGLAVHQLYTLGYTDLAKQGETSLRHYLQRIAPQVTTGFEQGDLRAEPPPEAVRPQSREFWATRPRGNLEGTWAHLPKYAHAFMSICSFVRDPHLLERARSLYYLMIY